MGECNINNLCKFYLHLIYFDTMIIIVYESTHNTEFTIMQTVVYA